MIQAFDFENYCKQLYVPDEKECSEFVMKDIKEASDKYLIYSAFNAINKIYALEYSVDYSRYDYMKQTALVRTKSRELLEKADIVMDEMIKRHMSTNKRNTGGVCKKGDAYTRACVYWFKQRLFMAKKERIEVKQSNGTMTKELLYPCMTDVIS